MKKKFLITGFEPFDKDTTNPSGDWINWMNSRNSFCNREICGVILPVKFNGGFSEFKKFYDEFCPDMVILTGLAKNRKELTVERIGINWVDARIPDNDGITITSQKIDVSGPDALFTTIDIDKLISLANSAGCVLKLSTSAGEYVCNELLYKVLCYLQDKKTPATFIHLPGLENYDGTYLALETIVNGL
ncbi:MAG: pyroglutamyl-peptidase I [Bacteriovorax sp.]|nr:pyroglutamyl-peptidase I [Bacteriovorax sp.]